MACGAPSTKINSLVSCWRTCHFVVFHGKKEIWYANCVVTSMMEWPTLEVFGLKTNCADTIVLNQRLHLGCDCRALKPHRKEGADLTVNCVSGQERLLWNKHKGATYLSRVSDIITILQSQSSCGFSAAAYSSYQQDDLVPNKPVQRKSTDNINIVIYKGVCHRQFRLLKSLYGVITGGERPMAGVCWSFLWSRIGPCHLNPNKSESSMGC